VQSGDLVMGLLKLSFGYFFQQKIFRTSAILSSTDFDDLHSRKQPQESVCNCSVKNKKVLENLIWIKLK
jgi:hypothetical protein